MPTDLPLIDPLAEVLDAEVAKFASYEVATERGTFSLEFGTDEPGDHVWNVASDPPLDGADLSGWTVLDEGSNYVVVDSTATDPTEAAVEFNRLAEAVGGELRAAQHRHTKRHWSGPPQPVAWLRKRLRGLTEAVTA
jgi:hypothetical protein